MIVEFKGRKIKGIYHLINTGVFNKKDYKKQQYMLFKGNELKETQDYYSHSIMSKVLGQDLEMDDEESDTQQKEPLKWSVSKPQRIVAAEQLYQMLKDYKL